MRQRGRALSGHSDGRYDVRFKRGDVDLRQMNRRRDGKPLLARAAGTVAPPSPALVELLVRDKDLVDRGGRSGQRLAFLPEDLVRA